MKHGDLALIYDPVRPDGSGTGTRGLHLIDAVSADEVRILPIDRPDQYIRVSASAVRIVWPASYVAEELRS